MATLPNRWKNGRPIPSPKGNLATDKRRGNERKDAVMDGASQKLLPASTEIAAELPLSSILLKIGGTGSVTENLALCTLRHMMDPVLASNGSTWWYFHRGP